MSVPHTTTIIHNHSFNPNYDIVWSAQFLLSGNNGGSGAFTTFLSDSTSLTGAGSGIDVGYSGSPGLSGAKLAIGFDTTGLFASTYTYPTFLVRNGTTPQPNMLVVRGGFPNFNLLFAAPLSALSNTFNLLQSSEIYQTLRFRLGNVGKTMYIDWRPSENTSYTPLTSVNVDLNVSDLDAYYVGFSFTTPVSTTIGWKETEFYIKHPVFEGETVTPTYKTLDFTPITPNLCDDCLIPTIYPTITAEIPLPPRYETVETYVVYTDCTETITMRLYTPKNSTLFTGPIFGGDAVTLFDGDFVIKDSNILYTALSGNILSSTPCEPYQPQVPVLFTPTEMFNNTTNEHHVLLSHLFS